MRTQAGWSWWVATTCVAISRVVAAQDTTGPRLSLDAAIVEALAHSPVLAPRVDTVTLAGIRQRVAASAFATKVTPSVTETTDPFAGSVRSVGVTVTKNLATGGQVFFDGSMLSVGNAAFATRDAEYTVGVSQPLLRGFRQTATADRRAADRAQVAATRELGNARAALVVEVARRYFAVIKAQRLQATTMAAAARAGSLTAASRARTEVGLATELDVLRAQVEESHLAASVTAAQTSRAAAEDDLAAILGRPLSSPLDIDTDVDLVALEDRLPAVPVAADDLVRMALGARTDVEEARDKVTDAQRAADIARWNLAPPIALDLSYTQRAYSIPGAPSSPLTGGWRVGLSTTYSVDHAAEAAALGTAQVASAAAGRAASEAARNAEVEVRRTYRAWQAAIETVDIQRNAVRLARRERDLASLRLARGLGDTLEVVAAEASLLEAQTALIGAELDRAALAIDLRRVVGVLPDGPWW